MGTLMEIRENNYQVFNRFDSDKKQELIKVVEYITMLSSTSATPVVDWDIQQLFGVRESGTNELIVDRREINRRFWSQADAQDTPAPVLTLADIPEEVMTTLDGLATRQAAAARASIENSIQSQIRSAQSSTTQAQQHMELVAASRLQLVGMTGEPLPLADELRAIIEQGFFQFQVDQLTPEVMVFHTPEVIMDWTRRNESTPAPVNMGSYRVTFHYTRNRIKVTRLQCNRTASGHIHPFMGGGGEPCWGNEGTEVNQHFAAYRWSAVFGILANILQRYDSDSNPYVELGHFADATQAAPRTGNSSACPECSGSSVEEDSDNSGPFYVCGDCGHDWE